MTPLAESRDRQDITQASGVRARDNLGPTQAIHTAQSHNAIRITKGGLRACPTPLHASEARQLERACLCNLQPGHPPQCHSESASIPSTKMGSPLSGSTAGCRGYRSIDALCMSCLSRFASAKLFAKRMGW
jgi:hypothetical protein